MPRFVRSAYVQADHNVNRRPDHEAFSKVLRSSLEKSNPDPFNKPRSRQHFYLPRITDSTENSTAKRECALCRTAKTRRKAVYIFRCLCQRRNTKQKTMITQLAQTRENSWIVMEKENFKKLIISHSSTIITWRKENSKLALENHLLVKRNIPKKHKTGKNVPFLF